MNKTAIMTDTNSGITLDIAEKNGIYLLKMPFIVDGKEYFEYGEMSYDEFFEVLASGADTCRASGLPAMASS